MTNKSGVPVLCEISFVVPPACVEVLGAESGSRFADNVNQVFFSCLLFRLSGNFVSAFAFVFQVPVVTGALMTRAWFRLHRESVGHAEPAQACRSRARGEEMAFIGVETNCPHQPRSRSFGTGFVARFDLPLRARRVPDSELRSSAAQVLFYELQLCVGRRMFTFPQ
jgi:hypothetical protein